MHNPCHIFDWALCDNISWFFDGDCCQEELPDPCGRIHGSISEKDIAKISIVT